MKVFNLDKVITACELEKVLQAGSNITITKIDDCTLEISSTGGAGAANGLKYHFLTGETMTVPGRNQYNLYRNMILDAGSTFTVDVAGQLVVHNGSFVNNGSIVINGELIVD